MDRYSPAERKRDASQLPNSAKIRGPCENERKNFFVFRVDSNPNTAVANMHGAYYLAFSSYRPTHIGKNGCAPLSGANIGTFNPFYSASCTVGIA